MKLKATIILAFAMFYNLVLLAQQIAPVEVSRQAYDSIKSVNPLYFEDKIIVIAGSHQGPAVQPVIQSNAGGSKANGCNLLQNIVDSLGNLTDNTYSVVPLVNGNTTTSPPDYRCDDNSTNEISLPFSFCFFGQTYNSIFISSNGLISFGTQYTSFLPATLPTTAATFVAPFWADVDTRDAASGLIYYKITPTRCIVQWRNVGYYSTQANLRNTFQVIITNGADPILPGTANVAFSYGDMQWAIGSTQGTGTGGFNNTPGSGNPTSVCTNIANLNSFVQFGRFDRPGSVYDGPFGNTDGIDWLDYQDIIFNNCAAAVNIPPIASNTSSCNGVADTICQGEVVPFSFSYFAPESDQTVDITITPATPGLTYSVVQNGASSTVTGTFVGGPNNIGTNLFTVTATDNGSPAEFTTTPFLVQVSSVQISPQIVATEDTICFGENTTLSLTANYSGYLWSPGSSSSPTITVNNAGQYIVQVTEQGCTKKDTILIRQYNAVPISITGPNSVCTLGQVALQASAGFTNYIWNPGSSNTSTLLTGPGTYTVIATDINGCLDTSAQYVVSHADPVLNIIGPNSTCFDTPVQLTAHVQPPANNYTYSWTPSLSTDSTLTTIAGTYTYIATYTDISGLCTDSDTITIVNHTPNVNITGVVPFCKGDQILLSTDNPFTQYSWFQDGQPIQGNNLAYASDSALYTVVVTDPFGCVDTASVIVDPVDLPTANFATVPQFGGVVAEPVQFNDLSTTSTPGDSIVSWQWSFTGGLPPTSTTQNPTSVFGMPYSNPGTPVTLIVTNTQGCVDTITVAVEIVPDMAPNVFTPGGANPFFVFPVSYVKPNCQLAVYNRWGHKVYESANYQNDWDGGGHTDGVYFYVYTEPDGKEHHGSVTILHNK